MSEYKYRELMFKEYRISKSRIF